MSDASLAATLPANAPPPSPPAGAALWSKGSFGFKDLLDIVNPLQHVPIVASIYRYVTGDEPSSGARITGDTLYGGPLGLGFGVVGSMLTDSQGRDLGERMLAAVFSPSGGNATPGTPSIAAAAAAPSLAALTAPSQPAPAPGSAAQVEADTQFARGLYRSPPPAAATPQQTFLAQNAQLQRRATAGQTNTRPVPLELTSNLLPIGRPSVIARPAAAAPVTAAGASPAASAEAATTPIAQKMRDALDKYEQLKKQQSQEDGQSNAAPAPVDLAM